MFFLETCISQLLLVREGSICKCIYHFFRMHISIIIDMMLVRYILRLFLKKDFNDTEF